MAEGKVYTITRVALKSILVASAVNERNITSIIAQMEKTHRHVNVISFASMLEKAGLDRKTVGNVFRRMGMDDITIHSAIDLIDEYKISTETGRLYEIKLDVG